MKYVPWSGLDLTGSVLTGSVRTIGSDRFGSDHRFGPVRLKPSVRTGSVRFGLKRFSVVCVIIGKSPYLGNVPSIPDYTKYRIIIACTVTVQPPMRVLHDMCHGRAPSGNDQLPKVVLHNY
jgi:hypothetical protein